MVEQRGMSERIDKDWRRRRNDRRTGRLGEDWRRVGRDSDGWCIPLGENTPEHLPPTPPTPRTPPQPVPELRQITYSDAVYVKTESARIR